ncbi:unnamed protein product, partial [Iphiclides podalirius]
MTAYFLVALDRQWSLEREESGDQVPAAPTRTAILHAAVRPTVEAGNTTSYSVELNHAQNLAGARLREMLSLYKMYPQVGNNETE